MQPTLAISAKAACGDGPAHCMLSTPLVKASTRLKAVPVRFIMSKLIPAERQALKNCADRMVPRWG